MLIYSPSNTPRKRPTKVIILHQSLLPGISYVFLYQSEAKTLEIGRHVFRIFLGAFLQDLQTVIDEPRNPFIVLGYQQKIILIFKSESRRESTVNLIAFYCLIACHQIFPNGICACFPTVFLSLFFPLFVCCQSHSTLPIRLICCCTFMHHIIYLHWSKFN